MPDPLYDMINDLPAEAASDLDDALFAETRPAVTRKVTGQALADYVNGQLAEKPLATTGVGSVLGLDGGGVVKSYPALISVKNFGAPSGSDWTDVFQAAIASGEAFYVPNGTYLVEGLTLLEGTTIVGASRHGTIIKLADGSNAHVMFGDDTDNVSMENFTIDGNKANQTDGQSVKCLYFTTSASYMTLKNLLIKDAKDHGFSMAGEIGDYCHFENLIAMNCGSAGHLSAGGVGGTGFAAGFPTSRYVSCYSTGNHLNGFKSIGHMIGCVSIGNTGGGFETGFSVPEYTQARYLNCIARNNSGDGWRNAGQIDQLQWIGGEISGNGGSGITIVNEVNRATINGAYIFNNGQLALPRSDKVGRDGIFFGDAILDPKFIEVANCHIFDNQGSPTQEYGVYFYSAPSGPINIRKDNVIDGNQLGAVYVAPSARPSNFIHIEGFEGCSAKYRNQTAISVTSTTSTTDLMSTDILADELSPNSIILGHATGSITGTNGTKTVRLHVGGSNVPFVSNLAGEEQDWVIDFKILRENGTKVIVSYRGSEIGGSTSTGSFSLASSLGSDLNVKLSCTLGDAADTITQLTMTLNVE